MYKSFWTTYMTCFNTKYLKQSKYAQKVSDLRFVSCSKWLNTNRERAPLRTASSMSVFKVSPTSENDSEILSSPGSYKDIKSLIGCICACGIVTLKQMYKISKFFKSREPLTFKWLEAKEQKNPTFCDFSFIATTMPWQLCPTQHLEQWRPRHHGRKQARNTCVFIYQIYIHIIYKYIIIHIYIYAWWDVPLAFCSNSNSCQFKKWMLNPYNSIQQFFRWAIIHASAAIKIQRSIQPFQSVVSMLVKYV